MKTKYVGWVQPTAYTAHPISKGEMRMQKRTLKELNLLDDFLFGSMVTYPGIGEEFSRELLRIIFQKDFGKLIVVPQKVYYGSDTDKHGTRLDVYLEEDVSGLPYLSTTTIYDVEPDQNDDTESIFALPRRVRFYHAKIDGRSLKSGESYRVLKNVIIIMIMPYDPFQLDRMVYTIQNRCIEEPDMPYDDGATTLFLYTKGTKGNPSIELQQLLHYMEHTQDSYATNEDLKKIQQMVDIVKQDEEVSLEYMKIFEREEMLINQGRKLEQENTKKAEQRTKATDILELLQEYGTVPEWLEQKIMTEQSIPRLREWHKASAKVESIEEFLEKTHIEK